MSFMRVIGFVLLASCAPFGCRSGPTGIGASTDPTTRTTGGLELTLSADNGHVMSPMWLTIRDSGSAELYVGGPFAWPGMDIDNRAGYFANRLSEADLSRWRRLVEAAEIPDLESADGPLPSGDYASLVLLDAGERHTYTIWREPETELAELLDFLREQVETLLEHPQKAIRVFAVAGADGQLHLELRHSGTEPLEIELFDTATAGAFVRIEVLSTGTTHRVERDAIVALVDSGDLPSGATTLEPGGVIDIPLSGVAIPADGQIELSVMFRSVGPGLARGTLRLHRKRGPLDGPS